MKRSRNNQNFELQFSHFSVSSKERRERGGCCDDSDEEDHFDYQHRRRSCRDSGDYHPSSSRSSSKVSHSSSSHCASTSSSSSSSSSISSRVSRSSTRSLDYYRSRDVFDDSEREYSLPRRRKRRNHDTTYCSSGSSSSRSHRKSAKRSDSSSSSPRRGNSLSPTHPSSNYSNRWVSPPLPDERYKCSPSSTNGSQYEILPMEYWERSPGCREAKLDHMDRMDHFCDENREYLILQTTLWRQYITLEMNMFPYDTPSGIEHWTLWCRDEMTHDEVCRYVDCWLARHMPHVRRWNYDSNSGDRSIELFHVHVYIETIPYSYDSPPSPDGSPVGARQLEH